MAALLLGPRDVKVMVGTFRRLADIVGGGEPRRTLNGSLRGDRDWVRRAWSFTAVGDTEAEANELSALRGTNLVATGYLLQDQSVTVRVEVETEEPAGNVGGLYRLLSFQLREV